jgi:4-hydroxybenzoate polyprenyltransferase
VRPPSPACQHASRTIATSCRIWLHATRWKQWIKNVLVFLPLIFAHQWDNPVLLFRAMAALAAFCAGASATYLVNDCLDHDADRLHPRRKSRPLAAGLITWQGAVAASVILALGGLATAASLSGAFAGVYLIYVVATMLYSLVFKQALMLDVLLLAGFYTIRIFGGAVATGIAVSNWLLLFSMFFFLFLAFEKRYSELRGLSKADGPLRRRSYGQADLAQIKAMGSNAGYLAVLVFALYIQSPEVETHYANPDMLWWICPCLLYWISRLALLAGRGQITEDAIAFAFRDKASYATGLLILVILLLAHPL